MEQAEVSKIEIAVAIVNQKEILQVTCMEVREKIGQPPVEQVFQVPEIEFQEKIAQRAVM